MADHEDDVADHLVNDGMRKPREDQLARTLLRSCVGLQNLGTLS